MTRRKAVSVRDRKHEILYGCNGFTSPASRRFGSKLGPRRLRRMRIGAQNLLYEKDVFSKTMTPLKPENRFQRKVPSKKSRDSSRPQASQAPHVSRYACRLKPAVNSRLRGDGGLWESLRRILKHMWLIQNAPKRWFTSSNCNVWSDSCKCCFPLKKVLNFLKKHRPPGVWE